MSGCWWCWDNSNRPDWDYDYHSPAHKQTSNSKHVTLQGWACSNVGQSVARKPFKFIYPIMSLSSSVEQKGPDPLTPIFRLQQQQQPSVDQLRLHLHLPPILLIPLFARPPRCVPGLMSRGWRPGPRGRMITSPDSAPSSPTPPPCTTFQSVFAPCLCWIPLLILLFIFLTPLPLTPPHPSHWFCCAENRLSQTVGARSAP